MRQSNDIRSESQRQRYDKNKKRISDKHYLSKQQKWEIKERLRIISEALGGNFTK